MQETLLKMWYFERGLSKNFQKLTWFFPFLPTPFYGQDYEKQKGPGTSYQSLFGLQNMYKMVSELFRKLH